MSLLELSEQDEQDEAPSRRPMVVLGLLWLLLATIMIITQYLQPAPITVEWRTETEINAAGFNVYRATSEVGPYTKVNESLIPGKGSPSAGADYVFEDNSVRPGVTYFYRLEDVELDNSSMQHPPEAYVVPEAPWWMPAAIVVSTIIGLILVGHGARQRENRESE